MSYPIWIYPEWSPEDFDSEEDYRSACSAAEESYNLSQQQNRIYT